MGHSGTLSGCLGVHMGQHDLGLVSYDYTHWGINEYKGLTWFLSWVNKGVTWTAFTRF